MPQFYNVIMSIGSRNSASGYGKIRLVLIDETEIIRIATLQANRRGYDLTHYSDIDFLGVTPDADGDCVEFKLSREWGDGEELDAAIKELTHDGYLYEIFKCCEQDAEFIARAAEFELEAEAAAFVE